MKNILLLLLGCTSVFADFAVYIKNSTGSSIDASYYSSAPILLNGATVATWGTSGGTIADGGTSAGLNIAGQTPGQTLTLLWPNGSGTNLIPYAATSSSGAVQVGDTGWVAENYSGTQGHYVFEVGGEGPPTPLWRFDIILRNDTYARQTYYVSSNSVQVNVVSLTPGSTLELSYRSNLVRFPVSISNGGVYPPFAAMFTDEASEWTLEDSTPVVGTLVHSMQGQGTLPSTNTMFGQVFTNSLGGTNASTDGTLVSGFTLIGGYLNQYGERTVELLEQMATNTASVNTNGQGFIDTDEATNYLDFGAISDAVFLNSGFIAGSNAVTDVTSSINSITNFVTSGSHSDDFWIVSFKEPGHPLYFTLDLRPTSHSWMASLAAWVKGLITWTAAMFVLYLIFVWTKEYAHAQGAFHIGRSPITRSISGGLAQGKSIWSSLFTHGLVFVVVAAISVAFMVIFVAFITGTKGFPDLVEIAQTNPFNASDESILEGLWLLSVFVDVPALIMLFILCIAYNSFLIIHSVAVQLMLRATPGLIVFCFLQLSAEAAAQLEVQNHTGQQIFLTGMSASGSEIALADGEYWSRSAFVGDEINVSTNSGGGAVTNWQNAYTIDDAKAIVTFCSDGAGGIAVLEEVTGTVWTSFYAGTKVGGALMTIAAMVWLSRFLRAGTTEGRLE